MNTHKYSNSLKVTLVALTLSFPAVSLAGLATSSAQASSDGYGPGTAGATASYDGDGVGFSKTKARTGNINVARGFSVGFDQTGLSLSHSYAVAGRHGPAVGSTLNVHIGQSGVALGGGRVVAAQDRSRQVNVSGQAGTRYHRPTATSSASGATGRRGIVKAGTFSRSSDHSRRTRRLGRHRPSVRRWRTR